MSRLPDQRLSAWLVAHLTWTQTRDDRGTSLVEYTLLIALIAIVCIAAVSFFGSTEAGSVNSSATSIIDAG